ncbi:hypothetical protein ESZ50_11475, partial [Weissella muntiaci]
MRNIGLKKALNSKVSNFKMYKSGKQWIFSSAIVLALGTTGAAGTTVVMDSMYTTNVSAATTSDESTLLYSEYLYNLSTSQYASVTGKVEVFGTLLNVTNGDPNLIYLDYTKPIQIKFSSMYNIIKTIGSSQNTTSVSSLADVELIMAGKTSQDGTAKRGNALTTIGEVKIGLISADKSTTWDGDWGDVQFVSSSTPTIDPTGSTTIEIPGAELEAAIETSGGVLVIYPTKTLPNRINVGSVAIPNAEGSVGGGVNVEVPDSNNGESNVGSNNSGDNNTGNSNVGSDNSGDNNTGNSNVGSDNSGDNNTGNSNVGSDNSGDNNTGNSNVGSDNSGDNNTGNSNVGSDNSGDNNT